MSNPWKFSKNNPILIWGAGAIGGILGAAFAQAGHKVHLVDIDEEHVRAINKNGVRVQGPVREFYARTEAFLPEEVHKSGNVYKLVFLAVKSHHTEAATRQLLPHLAEDGVIVSAQNGLNELAIASIAGPERTLGCFVNFSAEYLSPGLLNYGVRAAVVSGEIDGSVTPRSCYVHRLLREFDDGAILTDNIWGYLWSKMVYGTMLYAGALTDAPIWEPLAHPKYMDLLIALGREIGAIAAAEGVSLEPFDGFDPAAFAPEASLEDARASMRAMSEHNKAEPERRSGIWRDLKIRKRKTEVDGQLPPLVEAARRNGLEVPLTSGVIDLIHQCEEGLPQTWKNLDILAKAAT